MENIVKTYPCGLRLIVRNMPNFKSVSTNVYITVGSRNEQDPNKDGTGGEHGLSHFVEHMLFKGTHTRSAEDISSTLDGLGVDVNAFTSNDATCYYTRGLATNVDTCVDILSDMYFNTKFSDEDFYKEAEVIVQEITMRDDDPRSAMFDLARKTFFAGTNMGHDIAGTIKQIRSYKPHDIHSYIKKHYIAPKTIVSFAGDITLEQAEILVAKYFLPHFKDTATPIVKNTNETLMHSPEQKFATLKKDIEQHNVCLLFPIPNNVHTDRYTWSYIYEILGSGMSSRLFLSVREKLGLVYSISGGVSLYDLGGYFYVFFSCTPNNTQKVLDTIATELELFKQQGATAEEIEKVRNTRTASEMYQSESVTSTNSRIVASLAEFNKIKTTEEYLKKINSVTPKDIKRTANQFLNYNNVVIGAVGKDFKNIKPFVS